MAGYFIRAISSSYRGIVESDEPGMWSSSRSLRTNRPRMYREARSGARYPCTTEMSLKNLYGSSNFAWNDKSRGAVDAKPVDYVESGQLRIADRPPTVRANGACSSKGYDSRVGST